MKYAAKNELVAVLIKNSIIKQCRHKRLFNPDMLPIRVFFCHVCNTNARIHAVRGLTANTAKFHDITLLSYRCLVIIVNTTYIKTTNLKAILYYTNLTRIEFPFLWKLLQRNIASNCVFIFVDFKKVVLIIAYAANFLGNFLA